MAIRIIPTILVAIISILVAFVYTRRDPLLLVYTNSPGRLQQLNALTGEKVRFQNLVRNCEDAVLNDKEGWAVLSCDPGRDTWNTVMGTWTNSSAPKETGLYLYHYGDVVERKPVKLEMLNFKINTTDFHPLGITYHHGSRSLYMVNHGELGPSIEMFTLSVADQTATYRYTVQNALLRTPNSLVALDEFDLLVTNDHHFAARDAPRRARMESFLGMPQGNVVRVRLNPHGPSPSVEAQPLAGVCFANGIALLDSNTLAVASTTRAAVYIYDVRRDERSTLVWLVPRTTVTVPFFPDNLSFDGNGKLLIAGHAFPPTLERVAKVNGRCQDPLTREQDEECKLKSPSAIAEWSQEDGLRSLYVGDKFQTASTAMRDVKRGIGIATGLYERGLLMWKA